jgi:hypothetical protein
MAPSDETGVGTSPFLTMPIIGTGRVGALTGWPLCTRPLDTFGRLGSRTTP